MHIFLSLVRPLWRQRRLALLGVLALVLWDVPLGQTDAVAEHGVWAGGFLHASSALAFAPAIAFFCAAVRPLALAPAILAIAWPVTWLLERALPQDVVYAPLIATAIVAWILLDGAIDGYLPVVRSVAQGRLRTAVAPQTILRATVPGLGPAASYWGALDGVDRDPGAPNVRHVRYARGTHAGSRTVTIEQADEDGARYAFDDAQAHGRYDISIGAADAKGRRRVDLTQTREDVPFGTALIDWLTDATGAEADAISDWLTRNCDLSRQPGSEPSRATGV